MKNLPLPQKIKVSHIFSYLRINSIASARYKMQRKCSIGLLRSSRMNNRVLGEAVLLY